MNNYAELTIDGKKIGLLFGMIAAEEFYRLQLGKDVTALNNTLMIAEIMYAGAYNFATVKRVPAPPYEFIIDGVDELYADDEGVKQLNDACTIYEESRFGKNIKQSAENLKKKVDEQNQSLSISSELESSPTADAV